MPLVSLELHNFRIYESAQLDPNPYLNLIFGANASGKTSLLEAINLLGTGRSFRTTHTEQLRRTNNPNLSVFGKLQKDGGESTRLGFVFGDDGRRVSMNGLEQKHVSSLASQLPLQVISPDTHYEFQQSAKHRRAILDWGLFHVEPDFRALWGRYQRTLNQRNAALRDDSQHKARHIWDDELIETGEKLHSARSRVTEQLLPHFLACCQLLFGKQLPVDLHLKSGWEGDRGFGESLRRDHIRDLTRRFTHSGPQRADLQIHLNNQLSRQIASHGQYKMLIISLRVAQIRYLLEVKNTECCLLIDDLAAELDSVHRVRLTNLLASLPVQVFITATESSLIDRKSWPNYKTFHVEQGTVTS